jgi:hypothetical protein
MGRPVQQNTNQWSTKNHEISLKEASVAKAYGCIKLKSKLRFYDKNRKKTGAAKKNPRKIQKRKI